MTTSPEQMERVLKVVRRYTLMAAVDGRVGPFGGVSYTTEETLRQNFTVKDSKGVSYAPLDETALDPDMKNMVKLPQPVIANMLGALGQNLHFFVFPAKAKDGSPIADATKEGLFEVLLKGHLSGTVCHSAASSLRDMTRRRARASRATTNSTLTPETSLRASPQREIQHPTNRSCQSFGAMPSAFILR